VAQTFKCTICSSDIVEKGVKDFCSDGCRSIARRAREKSAEGTDTPPSSAKIREIRRILKDVRAKGKGEEKTISELSREGRGNETSWIDLFVARCSRVVFSQVSMARADLPLSPLAHLLSLPFLVHLYA
jgi:hypothetical protein